jgi:hypothetical protein
VNLLYLAFLGIAESVVWLWRMRTAHSPSAFVSGLAASAVTCCRLAFVYVGASAVIAAVPLWQALAAYVLPVLVATTLVHGWAERNRG